MVERIQQILKISIMLCSIVIMITWTIFKHNDRKEENVLIGWLGAECANELKFGHYSYDKITSKQTITITQLVNSIAVPNEIKVKVITECTDKYRILTE